MLSDDPLIHIGKKRRLLEIDLNDFPHPFNDHLNDDHDENLTRDLWQEFLPLVCLNLNARRRSMLLSAFHIPQIRNL